MKFYPKIWSVTSKPMNLNFSCQGFQLLIWRIWRKMLSTMDIHHLTKLSNGSGKYLKSTQAKIWQNWSNSSQEHRRSHWKVLVNFRVCTESKRFQFTRTVMSTNCQSLILVSINWTYQTILLRKLWRKGWEWLSPGAVKALGSCDLIIFNI